MLVRVQSKVRQFRRGVAQRGLSTTLWWTVYGLRPRRFLVWAIDLDDADRMPSGRPGLPDGMAIEVVPAAWLAEWRQGRPGLAPEFFQDEIDGVGLCAVIRDGHEVAGLTWIYRAGDPSRLFDLGPGEAELNHTFVRPAYRGRRLHAALLSFCFDWLRERGHHTVYRMTDATNVRSIRSGHRVGMRVIGMVHHCGPYRPPYRAARRRYPDDLETAGATVERLGPVVAAAGLAGLVALAFLAAARAKAR